MSAVASTPSLPSAFVRPRGNTRSTRIRGLSSGEGSSYTLFVRIGIVRHSDAAPGPLHRIQRFAATASTWPGCYRLPRSMNRIVPRGKRWCGHTLIFGQYLRACGSAVTVSRAQWLCNRVDDESIATRQLVLPRNVAFDPDRAGLAGVIAVLEDGYADALVVTKLDRLSRSASLMLTVTEKLEAAGIAIVSITESIDTSTPAGKLFRTVLAGVAEFEKELITERLVAGKRAKQHKLGPAAYIGGPTVPFGFCADGDVVVPHPGEWPVLERIRGERAAGATLDEIAAGLNRDGVEGKRGGRWHPGTLSRLLATAERLAGDAEQGPM